MSEELRRYKPIEYDEMPEDMVVSSAYDNVSKQLREAIAQRDEARKEVTTWRDLCAKAVVQRDNAHARMDEICILAADRATALYEMRLRAEKAEAALAAMTEDRNLWQDAHNEDCPNKVALDQSEAALATTRAEGREEGLRIAATFVSKHWSVGDLDRGFELRSSEHAQTSNEPLRKAILALIKK